MEKTSSVSEGEPFRKVGQLCVCVCCSFFGEAREIHQIQCAAVKEKKKFRQPGGCVECYTGIDVTEIYPRQHFLSYVVDSNPPVFALILAALCVVVVC